uniref:Uncharacterized protein n=1 Tax=Timema genevievae TaxID=629358 RepID=A0A7R9PM19_TIMGE|nr:unnamed protein product [Timema genevievae]
MWAKTSCSTSAAHSFNTCIVWTSSTTILYGSIISPLPCMVLKQFTTCLSKIYEYLISAKMMPLGFTLQELKNMGVLRSLVMNSNIVCTLHAAPAIDNWEEVTPDPAISDVDFVSVYEDMAVCGEVTDVYIVAEVLDNNIQAEDGTSVDEEDNSLVVQERPIPSAAEVMDHIQELRRFFLKSQQCNTFTRLRHAGAQRGRLAGIGTEATLYSNNLGWITHLGDQSVGRTMYEL